MPGSAAPQYLRYLRFLVGVGVRLAMQLAMNASPAPRGRSGSVAFCNWFKQKSSISLDAVEAEVTLSNDKKMAPTTTMMMEGNAMRWVMV